MAVSGAGALASRGRPRGGRVCMQSSKPSPQKPLLMQWSDTSSPPVLSVTFLVPRREER
jgi:hypothetical protein